MSSDDIKTVLLENDFLRCVFEIDKNRLSTKYIKNKLLNENNVLKPRPGSDEFKLRFFPAEINKNWGIAINNKSVQASELLKLLDGDRDYVIDFDLLNEDNQTTKMLFDFKKRTLINAVLYYPNEFNKKRIGHLRRFNLYLSNDKKSMNQCVLNNISFKRRGINFYYYNLPLKAVGKYRYMMIEPLKAMASEKFSVAEFDISISQIGNRDKGLLKTAFIRSRDLVLKNFTHERKGEEQTIEFDFHPYNYFGALIKVKEYVVLNDNDKFFRKYLKIAVNKNNINRLELNYYELNSFRFLPKKHYFSAPELFEENDLSRYGQPVHLDSFYLGIESPTSFNFFKGSQVFLRSYLGKKFSRIIDYNGYFETNKAICGVSPSCEFDGVREAFWDYLKKYHDPQHFVIQCNPTSELGENVTALNLQNMYREVNDKLTDKSLRPIDTYLVPEGWANKEGFWIFRDEFPNDLYMIASQMKQYGSSLAMHINLNGGEVSDSLSKWIQAQHNHKYGTRNNHENEINLLDRRYIRNMQHTLLNFQEEYNIKLWDIEMDRQKPFAPKNEGRYCFIKDGKEIYSLTDLYDNWLYVFNKLKRHDKNVKIILRGDIIPSPWLLKVVDGIEVSTIQNYDKFLNRKKKLMLKFKNLYSKTEMLAHRDNNYYKYYYKEKGHIPYTAIYTGELIYSKDFFKRISAEKEMLSIGDFSTLALLATLRGSYLYNLDLSPALLNSAKWQVVSKTLEWAEQNYDILKHMKMVKNKVFSRDDIYGYSATVDGAFIVSFFNQSKQFIQHNLKLSDYILEKNKDEKFKIEKVAGILKPVDEDRIYKYDDVFELNLPSGGLCAYKFSVDRKKVLEMQVTSTNSSGTIIVEFNRPVAFVGLQSFNIGGVTPSEIEEINKYYSYKLRFNGGFENGEEYRLVYQNKTYRDFVFYKDNLISDTYRFRRSKAIKESREFTICIKGQVEEYGQTLLKQGDDFEIRIDEEGEIIFKVLGTELRSQTLQMYIDKKKSIDEMKTELTTEKRETILKGYPFIIILVKEVSGAIKIYIDSSLNSTVYVPSNNDEFKEEYMEIPEELNGDVNRIAIYNRALSEKRIKIIDENF